MNMLKKDTPIGLTCDHAGYDIKQFVIRLLKKKNIPYRDFGCYSAESTDYADYAHPLAEAVEMGVCHPGIAICGSGNGINMTLNKHQGIRAALCWNDEICRLARQHNDANVCVMPGRFVTINEVESIVNIFLETPFEGGRHQTRIAKIPLK